MESLKKINILVNVIFPLIIGCSIYFISNTNPFIKGFIRNQLPDGLWAYSLTSSLLIIWDKQINLYWLLILAFAFIGIEILQKLSLIEGTYDISDIITYFIFSFFAFLFFKFYKKLQNDKIY